MNERELLNGLRSLAAAEPREAGERVEHLLMARFRARARERRISVWGSVAAGIGALAAAIAVLVWIGPPAAGPAREVQAQYDDAESFYPLPVADALPPLESGTVVRVELPMSSLRLMGVPVTGDADGGPIEADVLLGQDGLARGVRLIQ